LDIGDLGPNQSTGAVYNWKWYYSTPSLGLWLVLIAAFVFIKANRTPQALFILVPLLIVNLLWLAFRKLMGFRSSDAEMFDMMFHSLAVGITILWLFAHELGKHRPLVAFLLAFVRIAVLNLVGVVSYVGLEFSQNTVMWLVLLAMLALAMLLGFVLAGWRCQKRYSGVRFMLYLGFWMVAVCCVITVVVYSIVFIVQQVSVPVFQILLMFPVVGSVLGACVYVIVFPYMVLALRQGFFRERFFACLHLRSMPGMSGQPYPQELDPGISEDQESG
jgi:hypothetical protein